MTATAIPASFDLALDRLRDLLGPDAVATGDDLATYADPYDFTDDAKVPCGAVRPTSVEQAQQVVGVAAEHGLPLWTVSRGRNFAYGGASARTSGALVVDLSGMDAVLEVDEELGYAFVEPGVSFAALHEHLRASGSHLWISTPDLGWGSVLGNALERGIGYTSAGDHSAQVCGLEVVLADGRVVRTGMGAVPGSTAWGAYKGGYGPSLDGLFLQSNYGIVTKMGIWLAPAPEQVVVCSAAAPREEDLGALVDVLRPLILDGTISSCAQIGSPLAIASAVSERSAWYDGPGLMPTEVVDAVCRAMGLGRWNAHFALYGSAAMCAARWEEVAKAFAALPGVELSSRTYPGDPVPPRFHPADRASLGIPSTEMAKMAGWRGGRPSHTDFSLVCPGRGSDALAQVRLIRSRLESRGIDYAGGVTLYGRHAITLALMSFDGDDAAQRGCVRETFGELITDAAAAGYAPYRAHVAFMDAVAESYSAGDHAVGHLQRLIKDALDPRGILAPGKQGIWASASADVSRVAG